ncbi:MAG: response regulator [Myxococcales bacterium]|nr:response regulator [Myxococcales bacterium]
MSPLKLLLVEDNESHSVLMTERLTGLGAEVVPVRTIAGAIRLLETESAFDLAVLDQNLPDGSGFEVQDFLSKRSNPLPVLFVTADDHAEHAVRAMKRGARGYVVKRPEYLSELSEEVSSIIDLHQLHERQPTSFVSETRSEYEIQERGKLAEALQRNCWNVSATARELGIGRGKLRSRMSTLGLDE